MTNTQPNAPLPWLVRRLSALVAAATDALEAEHPAGVADWQQELSRQIARYSAASYLAGAGADDLSDAARAKVTTDIGTQLRFLGKFAVEVQDSATWQAGWNARAQMYADSIQTPYWRGATKMLALPALPGDGTSQCLTRCRCSWDVQELDGDGNYDAYWRTGAAEHCQTCVQRGVDWAPLQIREGVVML